MCGSDEGVSYSYQVSLLFKKQKSTKRILVMETQNKRPRLEFGCSQTPPKPIRSSLDLSTDSQRTSKT